MKLKDCLYQNHCAMFDSNNVNWTKDSVANYLFLKGVQQHANNVLQVRGHLFLNEVYDMIKLPRTPAGSVIGWLKDKEPNFVYFLDPAHSDNPNYHLAFNVHRIIWDKI